MGRNRIVPNGVAILVDDQVFLKRFGKNYKALQINFQASRDTPP
jgi:hypothetical protein